MKSFDICSNNECTQDDKRALDCAEYFVCYALHKDKGIIYVLSLKKSTRNLENKTVHSQ